MIVVIDNYDSFTYNLVQYLCELGSEVRVFRNDEISIKEIEATKPDRILISPGPCTPEKAGISLQVVDYFQDKLPLLGVCLGHQSIGQQFGGKIVHAEEIMHGKMSKIFHTGTGVFAGLPSPYIATRYHSLVIEKETLPECFEVTAWAEIPGSPEIEIMAVRHRDLNIEGVQFHPESITSEHGHQLLKNFIDNNEPAVRVRVTGEV